MTGNPISIKSSQELEILREAGKILSHITRELSRSLKSGITTKQVDDEAQALMQKNNVIPAFKGYRGFPGCICLSVNEQVVHGVPGQRILMEGDLVSLDVGIIHENYFSDTAVTVGIGRILPQFQKLIDATQQSLYEGIAQARVDHYLSDISHAVQRYVESQGFSVVREFVGHGIGRRLHEEPEVPNFGSPGKGPILKEGMVLAIEPMVNFGTWQTRILDDGWTVVTQDGKPSAHFEHTVAVTKNGPEILT